MLMKKSSQTKHQSPRKESFMDTKKTKKKMVSKKSPPISKRQTYSKNLQQDEKKDHSTDSYRERPSVYTEIWPSSEPSSPSDTSTPDKNAQQMPTVKFSEMDTSHSPVLARYVDRFRRGQPQSREERQQTVSNDKEEQLPFWWTSAPSLPPSLTTEEPERWFPCHDQGHNPCKRSTNMADTSQCVESEILQLQERASKLLQKGEFCLEEDSPPVSSDGVGGSDFSSLVSADEPVRRLRIPSLLQRNTVKDFPLVIPSSAAPTRPEEDILFQWRLRRKMEKAREWTQAQQKFPPHDFLSSPTFHPQDLPQETKHQTIRAPHVMTSDQQTQATTRSAIVDTSGSLGSLAHVPSHMHLLCDILPCPSLHSRPREESVSQQLDSQVPILPQETLNSVTKCMSPPKTPATGNADKYLHLSHTKSIEEPKKQPEKSEKDTSVPSKQHKKSVGVHNVSQQQKKKHIKGKKKSKAEEAPPPSPIHSALGQVVSEVLFPSVDSTQEISSAPPSCPVSAPQQCISGEVTSQLLHETEDSDEKEFEDDPLLQVLRKQRKWVKGQINEVDTLLKELPEQHNI